MNKQQLIRSMIGNPILRICSYPWIMYKHNRDYKRYLKSDNPQKIRSLKDSYKGRRCFIVGNGPSLKIEMLDILNERNEVCFGMNHIFDLYNETKWRPDFYFCYDRDFIRAEYDNLLNLPSKMLFMEFSKVPKNRMKKKENVYYYFTDYVFAVERGTAITDHVCTELDKLTSFVTNTTHLCLEFAMYMGFKEIYLVGVDHDYSFGYGKNHAKGIKEGQHNDSKVFCTSNMNVSTLKYEQYQKYAESKSVSIINATEGGKLSCFSRKGFYEVFS